MRPLISIIIPLYRQEKELALALQSIGRQSYRPIEVIVVDDNEVKNDQLGMKNIAFSFPLIFLQPSHSGAPGARNSGFQESKGAYVIFWDADVVGEPGMIEKMVNELEKNASASFVYCNFYFGWKKMRGQSFDLSELRKKNYIMTTSLIRREHFPLFDESLKRFQDWDLWLTLAEQGEKGIWIDEYLFRVKPGGTMSTWLPSFAYQKPWKWIPGFRRRVKEYEKDRAVIVHKREVGRRRHDDTT